MSLRPLIAAGSLLAIAVAAGLWFLDRKPAGDTGASGTIEIDEIRVASRYGGRVATLFAADGDGLTNGQVIAELDAAELRARHQQAAAFLEELRAGPRAEEIAAAKNEWEALKAELEFALADFRRAEELFAQRTISETERDRASTRSRALEKNVAASRSRYELLLAGTRPERLLQAAAQLHEIEAQLAESRIVAPTASILEVLHVRRGDVLAPNQPVATLVVPAEMWVRVFVPEPWLPFVALGEKVQVATSSQPAVETAGTVIQVAREAEFTPRNVQTTEERSRQVFGVKVRIDNRNGQLRAGMSAWVIFPRAPQTPQ